MNMKKIIITTLLLSLLYIPFSYAANKKKNVWYYNSYIGWYGLKGSIGYINRNKYMNIVLSPHYRSYYITGNYSYNDYRKKVWRYDPYYWNHYYYYDAQYLMEKKKIALEEIERLEQIKAESEKTKHEIENIKVTKARFYKQYSTDTIPVSMAEITIENRSKYPLRKIYFRGSLKTHITGKVLIDEPFAYEMAYTLEQGDRATYKIALNEFGNWSKVKSPDLAVFTVIITNAITEAGEQLIGSFSESDRKELNELKREYLY